MNNVEVIKGLESVIEGFIRIKDALEEQGNTPIINEPIESGEVSEEDLKSMNFNEFKKYASSLGVKCTGTREQILERILEATGKSDKSVEDTDGEDSVENEVESNTHDKFDEQAEEIAKDTSIEDILEALEDVGVKANKKNYVEKLAFALREGLVSLEDEDDDEEEEDSDVEESNIEEEDVEDEATEDEEEISSDSYFSEYDPDGINDPENMSAKREKAVLKKMESILNDIEADDITIKDIESYVSDNTTDDEKELLSDDYSDMDLVAFYMELVKRTIDDDGEEIEPCEPYEIGEENLCCGHILKYVKKTKKFVCEICGTEYEAE